MRVRRAVGVAAVVLAASGCGSTSEAAVSRTDTTAITKLVRTFVSAEAAGDMRRYCSTLTRDVRETYADIARKESASGSSLEQCARFLTPAPPTSKLERQDEATYVRELRRRRNRALRPGGVRVRGTRSQATARITGDTSDIPVRKEDGQWRVAFQKEIGTLS